MVDWETTQFPDEKLPRSTAEYQGFRRICVPDEKHEGKFGINVFGSEGDWQGEDYRLIILYEYWADPGFKGYESLTEAQKACIEVVDRYKNGRLKPTIMKRGKKAAQSTNVAGVKLRNAKPRTRKKN